MSRKKDIFKELRVRFVTFPRIIVSGGQVEKAEESNLPRKFRRYIQK